MHSDSLSKRVYAGGCDYTVCAHSKRHLPLPTLQAPTAITQMFSFTGETRGLAVQVTKRGPSALYGNLSQCLMRDHNDVKAVGIATTE